ncbi:MAG: gephyrin-like molybdotransferase Glp [Terracidiphilus sp.]
MPGALFELEDSFPPSAMPEPLWLCPATIHFMSSALPSYEEAAAMVADYAGKLSRTRPPVERVSLAGAQGRVLARTLAADQDQPPFARSTRDGYACRASEASAHAWLPVAGATHAGETPAGPLPPNAAWEIMTGAPVPAGANTVVMIEHVERDGRRVRLMPPRTTREDDYIVAQGAQAHKGDALLSAGTLLEPAQIALSAACGYAALDVFARPRVAILTTGDELVPVDTEPGPGQIRNSNAPMLAALVAAAGGEPWVVPTAADTAESLDAALAAATEADLLLISGGVSAGKFDLVEPALERMGARFHFTGVRIQPGKPLVFGELPGEGESTPLFGLPGNPISSAVTFSLFAAPVLAALAGGREFGPRFALAQLELDTDKHTKPGLTRFLPARCEFNPPNGRLPRIATVHWHGSGDLAAFAKSNCFLVVPEETGHLKAGEIVRFLLP